EVVAAVLVGDGGAGAAHQAQAGGAVVGQQRVAPALHERHEPASPLAGRSVTIVPNPSEVKTSSRIECATRPSMTWARGTPPRTARRHASIFGTMPADSDGSSAASSSADSREIR